MLIFQEIWLFKKILAPKILIKIKFPQGKLYA